MSHATSGIIVLFTSEQEITLSMQTTHYAPLHLCVKTLMMGLILTALCFTFDASAQKWRGPDKSPLDMTSLKKSRTSPLIARVIYSRPQKKGRTIFGELVPYGKLWRTGANEATEVTFYRDVTVGGKAIKAGSYALFTIPQADQWTVILSTKPHQWGSYGHQESDEAARIQVPVKKTAEPLEYFSISLGMNENDGVMYLGWDNVMVAVPIGLGTAK